MLRNDVYIKLFQNVPLLCFFENKLKHYGGISGIVVKFAFGSCRCMALEEIYLVLL